VRFASIALLLGLIFVLVSQTTHAAMFAVPAAYGSCFAEVIWQGMEPDRAARSRHASNQSEFQERGTVRLNAAPGSCFYARFSASHSLGRNGSAVIGTANPAYNLDIRGSAERIDPGSGSAAAALYLVGRNSGAAGQAAIVADFNGGIELLPAASGNGAVGINAVPADGGSTYGALQVNGSAAIGAGYYNTGTVPTNGMIVQGSVGVSLNGTEFCACSGGMLPTQWFKNVEMVRKQEKRHQNCVGELPMHTGPSNLDYC
jgi:hypothetical protein